MCVCVCACVSAQSGLVDRYIIMYIINNLKYITSMEVLMISVVIYMNVCVCVCVCV